MLRRTGVVGKFVEFYGDGLDQLPLADRATIANMAPEYGATCGFFPIDRRDHQLSEAFRSAGRDRRAGGSLRQSAGHVARVGAADAVYTATLELDLSSVVPSLAGPSGLRTGWR